MKISLQANHEMKKKILLSIKKFNIRKQREHFKLADLDINCRRVLQEASKNHFKSKSSG